MRTSYSEIDHPHWSSRRHPITRRHLAPKRKVPLWVGALLALVLPLGFGVLLLLQIGLGLVGLSIASQQPGSVFDLSKLNQQEIALFIAIALWLFTFGLWAGQIVTNAGASLWLTLLSCTSIAYERETQNWELLRITMLSIFEIVNAHIIGLLRRFAGAFIGIVITHVLGIVVFLIANLIAYLYSNTSSSTDLFAYSPFFIIAALAFLVDNMTTLLFSGLVGTLASSFARTRGMALGAAFVLHLVFMIVVFAPAQIGAMFYFDQISLVWQKIISPRDMAGFYAFISITSFIPTLLRGLMLPFLYGASVFFTQKIEE